MKLYKPISFTGIDSVEGDSLTLHFLDKAELLSNEKLSEQYPDLDFDNYSFTQLHLCCNGVFISHCLLNDNFEYVDPDLTNINKDNYNDYLKFSIKDTIIIN